MEKSRVRVLLKKGVSKGSEMGFDIEVDAVSGDTTESLEALGKIALNTAYKLMRQEIKPE